MNTVVHSVTEVAGSGTIIDAECHISNGLPTITIVGLATKAVDEARERVTSKKCFRHLQN